MATVHSKTWISGRPTVSLGDVLRKATVKVSVYLMLYLAPMKKQQIVEVRIGSGHHTNENEHNIAPVVLICSAKDV